jgi:hypothetical protein
MNFISLIKHRLCADGSQTSTTSPHALTRYLQPVSNMLKLLYRIIFWSSLLFLAVFLWTVTIGQTNNFDFRNHKTANDFYNVILGGTPIAIFLTLFGTLKTHHDKARKLLTIFATIGLTVLTFMFLLNNLFTIGFGTWTTFNIAYQDKTNPERQIREQRYDVGALGYGSERIVEVKPFAGLFWQVSTVDTNKIDKTKWVRVDKEADIKFP